MDGYQDDADSLRGSGGRMILKMGFRTLTSPKRSAERDKNEPSRFLGDGVSFRAKLIGILEVGEARGERMCQEALADLKMAVRAAGEHKQRIVVCVAIDGLRLRDDKTGDCLYHHPVHKISFIAQDMTDSRAFGYIFGSPDTGHRFFGIKTDKAASQVVIAMRDLFQVVFELKKKEIEMAKQHIEQQQQLKYSSSGASKYSDLSSKESGDQGKMRTIAEDQQESGGGTSGSRGSRRHISSSAAVVAISPPPRHPNALQHQQQTSEEKENLNGNAAQIAMGVGEFSSGKGLASGIVDDKGSANSSAQFDVFTELDPLGTGRSRPYVDKKDFFQDLKNPPKKVLRDLVTSTDSPSTHSAAAAAPPPPPSAPAATPFCSSTATVPLFHAMFDAGDGSQSAVTDLFASSDLFFPPSAGVSFPAVPSSHATATAKDLSRFSEGVFPPTASDNFPAPASSVVPSSPLLSSIASATDSTAPTAEDPFADTDPFADEASAPVVVSLSDVDVADIFPRIEDDPFDTELADFATLSTSRRKRVDYSVSGSATVGRKPRSSKGITHGPLRVSLPPEKKSLDSPVLLPPPPGDGTPHSTGTIPRSRSRSPRVARQASAGCSTSPKSALQQRRAGPMVARTPSEGAYSSSPQSPPEPPPRPPSSADAGAKPPPLPPKRVAVGPTAANLPTPLRQTFPDDEDASQYEFIDQYETSPRPTVEAKTVPRATKKTTGLPPPPRRQHQRASPSGEPSAATETTKRAAIPTDTTVSAVRSGPPQSEETAAPPATSFDLTLAELGRMSIADLASALHIPPERVSTMTLQELAEKLSACRTKASAPSDKSREEEEHIKRDRYAALRESLDDEFVTSSTNFNADFDAKFDEEFTKEDGPKIVDDVFQETSFDKYAVFRELIDSEADVNEKADEMNDGAAPTEEETGSVDATEEVRGMSPQNDASDASKEGDVCSPTREQREEKESAGGKEEEEESSREEAADKYAALREICLPGEKSEEAGAAAETNSSEERNEKVPEEAVTGDLLVLSRQASEAAEEGKAESGAATEEGDGGERKNAGWANFDAEKATDGGESEEAASPWS